MEATVFTCQSRSLHRHQSRCQELESELELEPDSGASEMHDSKWGKGRTVRVKTRVLWVQNPRSLISVWLVARMFEHGAGARVFLKQVFTLVKASVAGCLKCQ